MGEIKVSKFIASLQTNCSSIFFSAFSEASGPHALGNK